MYTNAQAFTRWRSAEQLPCQVSQNSHVNTLFYFKEKKSATGGSLCTFALFSRTTIFQSNFGWKVFDMSKSFEWYLSKSEFTSHGFFLGLSQLCKALKDYQLSFSRKIQIFVFPWKNLLGLYLVRNRKSKYTQIPSEKTLRIYNVCVKQQRQNSMFDVVLISLVSFTLNISHKYFSI